MGWEVQAANGIGEFSEVRSPAELETGMSHEHALFIVGVLSGEIQDSQLLAVGNTGKTPGGIEISEGK